MALLADDDDDRHEHRGRGQGRGHQKHDEEEDRERYFRQQDRAYLREYYGAPADLPPGLRKKYIRTGSLPPGWEKRIRPFPPALVQRLPPPPPYCERGYVDGYAVIYDRRTRVILDVIDIVNAAGGR